MSSDSTTDKQNPAPRGKIQTKTIGIITISGCFREQTSQSTGSDPIDLKEECDNILKKLQEEQD